MALRLMMHSFLNNLCLDRVFRIIKDNHNKEGSSKGILPIGIELQNQIQRKGQRYVSIINMVKSLKRNLGLKEGKLDEKINYSKLSLCSGIFNCGIRSKKDIYDL